MKLEVVAAFVPLVDAAVLVAARERGFAAAEGIDLVLVREPSWASLRDHLLLGHVDCAHALAPLPIASTLGVGHVQVDCIVPFVLSRGGNAVTVSNRLYDEMLEVSGGESLANPVAAGAALAAAARRRAQPLTLAMVFPFSSHNFELRYWLAASGLHPDRDVRIVAIPPPLMVESLRAGHVDGFCVGEPWSSRAVAEGLGPIVATKSQLFPFGVEKVLAVRAELESQPVILAPLLRALAAAARWADDPENHRDLAALLGRAEYLDTPATLIERALCGRLELGPPGAVADDPEFLAFARRATNVPSTADALFIYAQMVRWGHLRHDAAREARAARVFRADLYGTCIGETPPPPPPAMFDGIACERDVADYVRRFAIATPYDARSFPAP